MAGSIRRHVQLRLKGPGILVFRRVDRNPSSRENSTGGCPNHQCQNTELRGRLGRNRRDLRKQNLPAPKEEIVDASNLILGRMATYVAKKALEGNRMVIVNAERAVISGTKARVVARAKTKLKTRTLA